ncbi:conserved hypothetical protein [Paraburkholderia sacchari]
MRVYELPTGPVGNFVEKAGSALAKGRAVGFLLVWCASRQNVNCIKINDLRFLAKLNANRARNCHSHDKVCISQVLTSFF